MESRYQMKAEKMQNINKVEEKLPRRVWTISNISQNFFKVFLFYTFNEEKQDQFFLRSKTIVIFSRRLDTVFWFYCATQRKKGTLIKERTIEDAYTNKRI